MKKLKKLTAVLLSLAMTAMLSVPAFAAGEYSITINSASPAGKKIFKKTLRGKICGKGNRNGGCVSRNGGVGGYFFHKEKKWPLRGKIG